MTKKPEIYIAGPMRGYEDDNSAAFDRVRDYLSDLGWKVHSPVDMERATRMSDFPFDTRLDKIIQRDIDVVMKVDALYMLRGWERSTGARAEYSLAQWRDLVIYFEPGAAIELTPPYEIGPSTPIDLWTLKPLSQED